MAEDDSANPRANFYYLGPNSFSSPINECDELQQLYDELDDNYLDERYSNSEDDAAIAETVDETTAKKARVEQPVTKPRYGSIPVHTRKAKFMRKYQGAAVYKSKFQLEWQRKWPCITSMKDKPNYFYCTVCAKTVSCGHQGEKDVTRHMDSVLHKKNVSSVQRTEPLKVILANLMKKVRIVHFYIFLS